MLLAPAMSEAICAPDRGGTALRGGGAPMSIDRAGTCRASLPAFFAESPTFGGGERARRSGCARPRRLGSSSSGDLPRGRFGSSSSGERRRRSLATLGLLRRRLTSSESGERRRLRAGSGDSDDELSRRRPLPRGASSDSSDESEDDERRRGMREPARARHRRAAVSNATIPTFARYQIGIIALRDISTTRKTLYIQYIYIKYITHNILIY